MFKPHDRVPPGLGAINHAPTVVHGTRETRSRVLHDVRSFAGLLATLGLMLALVACGSTAKSNGSTQPAVATSGAPRIVGRGQGAVPPPTVTIAPTATPGGNLPVSFGKEVLPILISQCGSCHGGQGGLWLTTYEQVLYGGTSGKVVVPGQPDQSLLYQRITGQKAPRMPLGAAPLTQAEIDAIKGWIAEGAPKN